MAQHINTALNIARYDSFWTILAQHKCTSILVVYGGHGLNKNVRFSLGFFYRTSSLPLTTLPLGASRTILAAPSSMGPWRPGLHLCLHCPFARAVWDQADPARSPNIMDWWEPAFSSLPKSPKRDFNGIVIYTLWNIWKERNRRIFENSALTPLQIALRTKEDVLTFRRAMFPL
ncbi:hypothetical protein BS78_05G211800 [Paspalum vaginatum]|nr:hypothetical protein BS78_05G211800 [Paspalum vaginatum]